jgi:hypothetical protein
MKRARPETPHVFIGENIQSRQSPNNNAKNDLILRNFSNFMRQIVDNENDKFLNGDINVIDYVLAKYLKLNITEIQNLRKLNIKINGSYGLLNQFGQRLVNLKFLKLNDSFIQSIDDLGSNFKNLKILQINNCKLKELSGIICFEQLEIFEAKNNEISDLIELEMSTSLVKINLENNLIEDEQNIYFLSSLDNLEYINLRGNPIKNYEKKLKELLPNLKEIDVQKEICDDEDIYNNDYNNNNNDFSNNTNNKINIKKDNNIINNITESTKLSTSTDLKKNESGENDNVEIVDDNNNIIQELMESKTKFDFKKTNIKDLKPKKDLKPVIAKKKENKEIKILRETFSKEQGKNEIKNINNRNIGASKNDNLANSAKFKKGMFSSGIRTLKDMKGKNEKIVIKSKNTKDIKEHKGDKFFEELKKKRMMGNK